jgi:transposase
MPETPPTGRQPPLRPRIGHPRVTTNCGTRVLAPRNNGMMDQPEEHEHDPATPRRRTFTAERTLEQLVEYDAADRDAKGALLPREAIYTSHISDWRKARDRGTVSRAARRCKSAEQVELERLRERTERHEAELAKTKLALDITPAISDEAAKLHPGADPRLAAAPAQRIDVARLRTRHQPDRAGLDQLLSLDSPK